MFSVATCPLTHRPMHSSAFLPPTVQFPLKHPSCPFGERGIDGGKERGRERGMVEGLDLGMEDYPCMQNHKFTHPGWA